MSQVGPPAGYSAARRIGGLTKYLARAGHEVTVLTSLAFGSGPVPGAHRTVRTRDLVATNVNPRRARFEAVRDGAEDASDDYDGGFSPVAYAVVPDLSLVGWLPFALPRALALARRHRFDCVITSSPPESGHLIGLALQRRGIPWIADFRDGWAFESTHPDWPLGLQHQIDAGLERTVATRADLVLAVSEPITEHLREHTGARALTLTNGFDPEETSVAARGDDLLSADRHSLVHTGRMAFSGRSPDPVIEAAARLETEAPELAARLELAFAGPLSSEERASIERPTEHVGLRALGTLDHARTLALQQAADGLLLITGGGNRGEATAKLYEYLAAARPILVLGEASAAAEIVRSSDTGIATSASDPRAIAEALRALLERPADAGAREAARAAAEPFSYPRLAQELVGHIERVLAEEPASAYPPPSPAT